MCPHRACEKVRRFIAFVGFSLGGRDQSEGPPIASNLDRYNSVDGRLRLKSI